MKKLVLFFVLQLIIANILETVAQTNTRDGSAVVSFLPQGYGIKLLNSSGTSSIINDVSNLGFLNPASISEFENYSFGFSYQFNTSIDEAWIADFGTSRVYNFYPQSAGGNVKWNDFTFGLGFGQKYNGTIDTDPIPVSTIANPDSIVDYITPIIETIIHSYSISIAYSLNKLLETSNDFSIGFRYNLNRFSKYEQIGEVNAEAEDFFHSFNFGLFSSFNLDETRNISLGLCYETKSEFNAEIEFNSGLLAGQDTNITRPPGYYRIETPTLFGEVPDELRFDLAFDAASDLKLLANLTSVFWATETNSLKDQIEFSFSAVYKINEIFTPSLGFYITDSEYTDSFYSRLNEGMNALFMTAGLRFNYDNFSADLAIADSHLFSGDYRKQTIGKLSLGINL